MLCPEVGLSLPITQCGLQFQKLDGDHGQESPAHTQRGGFPDVPLGYNLVIFFSLSFPRSLMRKLCRHIN